MSPALALLARGWAPLTTLVLAGILWLSLIPVERLDGGGIAFDKVKHVAAYAALALPVSLARPRGWPWIVAAFLGAGAAIELVQPAVGRSTSALDLAANAAGLVAGVLVASRLRRAARGD